MLRILHFCPIPSFLRIAVILLQQLSRLWFSGLFTVTINFEKFRIVWNCVELCGIVWNCVEFLLLGTGP